MSNFLSPIRQAMSLFVVVFALSLIQGCASTTKWKVDAVEPSRKGIAPKSISVGKFHKRYYETEGKRFASLLAGKLQDQKFVEIKPKGAEGHLTGLMKWGQTKRDSWSKQYEYKGEKYNRYYAKIRKNLTVSYQLEHNGRTYAGTYEKSYEDEESSRDGYSKAKAGLATEDAIKARLMDQAANEIVRDITPYRVKRAYKIKLGDTDKLELGADYLKIGRQDQAMEIFRQIAEKAETNEDRAAAIYNQGVIHEAAGRLDKAFKAYRDASQLHLEELMYPKAITRLEGELKTREQLNKQLESLKK